MASLCTAFQGMSVRNQAPLSARAAVRGTSVVAVSRARVATPVGFFVDAAQNSLKRQRTSEKARLYNKAKKSEIFTRSKKAFVEIDMLTKAGTSSEADFANAEKLIGEAMGAIDKAVVKGVLHKNTGDRRKSKLCRYKTRSLIKLGLYEASS
eukprot:CAMPEP_0114226794 /NCGR_PEP_ID=MMETSP0058-20121206/1430_1 /TAXON_ID=36894 /ORGANISM="Pyramimonas parkeae, CCMP726" /LENGTH=151 /DNA_ID=CAMNT_0001337559 /DNA_START=69 /DNA_END=524 /DNA_ORIENTATION=-